MPGHVHPLSDYDPTRVGKVWNGLYYCWQLDNQVAIIAVY